MPSLAFLGLLVGIGLLLMIPTRRLFLAGWSSGSLAIYLAAMLGLGLLVAELRGPAKYLIPIFVLAYIAPFITARDGINRLRGRFGGPTAPPRQPDQRPRGFARPETRRPEPKNVTPKDAPKPDARA